MKTLSCLHTFALMYFNRLNMWPLIRFSEMRYMLYHLYTSFVCTLFSYQFRQVCREKNALCSVHGQSIVCKLENKKMKC
jgi:hypothetical protein